MVTVTIKYTTSEVPGRGWIARAEEINATAQGATEDEAFRNLRKLVERYPDLVEPLLEEAKKAPTLELVHA